jgi:hypothetical protein
MSGERIEDLAEKSKSSDPLDLESLRLSQDYWEMSGVEKPLVTVPVRKPDRQEFIRVRPGDQWRLETAILTVKATREAFLVARNLWHELPGEITPVVIFTVVNRQGVLFLWPVRLPGEDGRQNPWHRSALEAAQLAETRWVRVAANQSLGAYDVFLASADLPDPEWPPASLQEIVKIAFRDQFIESDDHPVVKQLRGMM